MPHHHLRSNQHYGEPKRQALYQEQHQPYRRVSYQDQENLEQQVILEQNAGELLLVISPE